MEKEYILHLIKDKQLIGNITPDARGMDHIVYPDDTSVEVQNDVLRILSTLPAATTIEQRIENLKTFYMKEGYTVEDAI